MTRNQDVMRLLPPRHWQRAARAVLLGWLSELAQRPAGQAPETAVFDWDNTCLFNDLSFASLRVLLARHPHLRLPRAQLETLLPTEIWGRDRLACGVSLAAVRADVLGAYDEIVAAMQTAGQSGTQRLWQQHSACRDLAATLFWFYDALEATDEIGARFAYPWFAQLFAGASLEALAALSRETLNVAAAEPFGETCWQTARLGRVGAQLGRPAAAMVPTGLAAIPEIVDLMHAMAAVGVRAHVVTATCEPLARAAAVALGFPLPAERIFGQRLAVTSEGFSEATCPMADTAPVPHREGKALIIREHLRIAPIFVAGDTPGDVSMFRLPSVRVGLVVDRGRDDELTRLCVAPPAGVRVLRQWRDESLGRWTPMPRSAA